MQLSNGKLIAEVELKEIVGELFLYFVAKNSRSAVANGLAVLQLRYTVSASSSPPRFILNKHSGHKICN